MILKTKLFGKVYAFKSLNEVMAKANEEKSGDRLAGLAAESFRRKSSSKGCIIKYNFRGFKK